MSFCVIGHKLDKLLGLLVPKGRRSTVLVMATEYAPVQLRKWVDAGVWQPNGFGGLHLQPLTFPLHWSRRVSVTRLKERFEAWEHQRGNREFEAVRLEMLPSPAAYELVATWVSLREWFPEVRADRIDFGSVFRGNTDGSTVYGMAFGYPALFPQLHDETHYLFTGVSSKECSRRDIRSCDLCKAAIGAGRSLRVKMKDPRTHGSIQLSRKLWRSPKDALRNYQWAWEMRGDSCESTRPFLVSAGSYTLIHEFGHLVDLAVLGRGMEGADTVYGSLSECVLGREGVTRDSWSGHLLNMRGSYSDLLAGPQTGGVAREKGRAKRNDPSIRNLLGEYACTSRDECFAEAFALGISGNVGIRRQLAPFIRSLKITGVRKQRRSA